MNRINSIFASLRSQGGKALMPFITAGDPDVPTTGRILKAIQDAIPAGAGICELGIPFSDPIADGPVIQASMGWALDHGVRPGQILDMVAQRRGELEIGLIAMVSYSIVYRLTPGSFLRDCKAAGIDGFIFPDLPVEESEAVREMAGEQDLICSFLVSPTTSPARAEQVARACSGFVYVLARSGITGERSALPADLSGRIASLRQVTDLPIAVGFGVSSAQQVQQVVEVADAAIVGSAIVRRMADQRAQGADAVVRAVGSFVSELAGGLPAPRRR